MINKDKVMKALKKLSKDERQYFAGYNMAEVKKQIGLQELAEDTLVLLKAQEEKKGKWHLLSRKMPPKDGKYLFHLDGIKRGFSVIGYYDNGKIWWWSVNGKSFLDKDDYRHARWTEIPKP